MKMKTVIITGASSGLGREYALAASKRYPDTGEFWLIARRADRLESIAEEIGRDKTVVLPLDLCEKDALKSFSDYLAERSPEVTLLINDAGFGKLGSVADIDPLVQREMCNLNCGALTAVTAMTLKYMPEKAGIINVCSIASFAPTPRMSVYCATKSYVMAFSRALREELKSRKIGVTAVCPGPMTTEFLGSAGISPGRSRTFDTLPYCDPEKTAVNSLKALDRGSPVYTEKLFYKLYRVLGKLLPHSLVMKFTRC